MAFGQVQIQQLKSSSPVIPHDRSTRPRSGTETIVAIATPPAPAGIGIIRLSGPDAIAIGRKLFRSNHTQLGKRIRHVEFGVVLDEQGREIDQGLAWVFAGPYSYTGEDTVEISCHGSLLVLEAVVRAAVSQGAALAQPGEFTRRAYLNGKLDLIQAEAVIDLIHASDHFSLDNAYGILKGQLSEQVRRIGGLVLRALAFSEATLDFPEDVSVGAGVIAESLSAAIGQCAQLASTFSTFTKRGEGFLVAIVGPPNAGKSSLFNLLLKESRAIVSPDPGTTRDLIESRLYVDGELYRIIDSAGLRDSADPVEIEGISRAYGIAVEADVVLLVLDSSCPWSAEFAALCRSLDSRKDLVVLNKADLPTQLFLPEEITLGSISVSALSGVGIDTLLDHLRSLHSADTKHVAAGLTRLRHVECLSRTKVYLEQARSGMLQSAPAMECVAEDLHAAHCEICTLLGTAVGDEVLDLVFSEFCIGK